ncbi:MAG: DUF3160 domain-containing protein, partial [Candidatus Brocadiia bacterium]
MSRKIRRTLLAIATLVILAIAGLQMLSGEEAVNKMRSLPFAKYYEPVKYEVNSKVEHSLPAKLDSIAGAPALKALGVSPDDKRLISSGFVLSDAITGDDISAFYKRIAKMGIPTLITTDSMLHIHHALFDDMMAQIEEETLSNYLALALTDLLAKLPQPDVQNVEAPASTLARQYLSVALALLNGQTSSDDPVVRKELQLIEELAGFSPSPIFTYKEDYSQYVPRGHYTKDVVLGSYFKAMMWLGRLTFLVRGIMVKDDGALVEVPTAKMQILAALLIASQLEKSKFRPQFDAIYEVTAFFVGYSDDLSPYDYLGIARKIVKNDKFSDILEQPVYLKFLQEVLRATPPSIYSGTGEIVCEPGTEAFAKALASTTGMRLMGQRFVPDAYIHGRLVYPIVTGYTGKQQPSTGTGDRILPSSLDVMRILGSVEAAAIEKDLTLDAYSGFSEEISRLSKEFSGLSPQDWHRNLYFGWLNSLSALFADKPALGYQPFQKSASWRKRQLNSALGSWTALRHDTVLYVKQPYTMTTGAPPVAAKPPAVYVEPEPEVYARLLALNRQMAKGLVDLRVVSQDDMEDSEVARFTDLLQTLLDVSVRELEGQPLSKTQM